mgnify:CR=1 FL=1
MSANFPTNRQEAGLGSGPLQEGDQFVYNSIAYTWVLSPDGNSGAWSSKGINVNPELYIAKNENFNANLGVISGSYSGTPFSVSSAGNAAKLANEDPGYYNNLANATGELDKARLPTSIDANTTGSAASATNASKLDNQLPDYYRNADNINAGELDKARLPTSIDANTSGNAATADTADKVANALTINYYGAGLDPATDSPTTTITYDGELSKSINIVDTDEATVVLPFTAGTGLSIDGTSAINVNQNIARTVTNKGNYVVNGQYDADNKLGQYLKAKEADFAKYFGTDANENGLPPSHYLNRIKALEDAPDPDPGKTYQGSSTINIDTDTTPNQISVANKIARGVQVTGEIGNDKISADYVANFDSGSQKFLRAVRAFKADSADMLGDKSPGDFASSDHSHEETTAPTPTLKDVIIQDNPDNVIDDNLNAIIYLQNSNGNNKVILNGSDGGINLRHDGGTPKSVGGYIDFGDYNGDAKGRIYYQDGNLNVKVPGQNDGDAFTLKPVETNTTNPDDDDDEGGSGAIKKINNIGPDEFGNFSLSLNNLSNVNVGNPSNGDVLKFIKPNASTQGQWLPRADEVGNNNNNNTVPEHTHDSTGIPTDVVNVRSYGTNTAAVQAAFDEINRRARICHSNGNTPPNLGIYFPTGIYEIGATTLEDLAAPRQVSIFGDGISSSIRLSGTMRFESAVNVRNLEFICDTGSNPGIILARNPSGRSNNACAGSKYPEKDDGDSSFMDCDFNLNANNSSHVGLLYNGRNLKFHNNRMKTAKNVKAGVQIVYNNDEASGIQGDIGFRRTSIMGNTFHVFTNSEGAVLIETDVVGKDESVPNYGLVFQGNTIDHGGKLLTVTGGGGLVGAAIIGNTCYYDTVSYITISKAKGCAIIGNTFIQRRDDGPDGLDIQDNDGGNSIQNNPDFKP